MPIDVKACRHGRFMFYTNDYYIGRSLGLYGEYSEDEIALWAQLIKPGWTVIDAGANIGTHAVWFGKAVKTGKVYAIEPQRQLYHMLCGNLALNELRNVSVVLGALGAESGTIAVPLIDYRPLENYGAIGLRMDVFKDKPHEDVPLLTLDAIKVPANFIKIDVEGMEREVIAGAKETLRTHKPIIYVENDRAAQSSALIEDLMLLDYRLYWHVVRQYRPDNFAKNADNIFPGVVCVNMLGVHASLDARITGLKEIKTPDDVSGVRLS